MIHMATPYQKNPCPGGYKIYNDYILSLSDMKKIFKKCINLTLFTPKLPQSIAISHPSYSGDLKNSFEYSFFVKVKSLFLFMY